MQSGNVFQTVAQFVESHPVQRQTGNTPLRITHCFNTFPAEFGSEHERAQTVTLASMKAAREVSWSSSPDLEIKFVSVVLEGESLNGAYGVDKEIILKRSICDLKSFQKPRNLPLLHDILSAVDVDQDDILIFTNVDIAVMPQFYRLVADLFSRGVDCAYINRRTVSDVYTSVSDLDMMSIDVGKPHPGYDCLALRGHLREKLVPYDSCVGIGNVMLPTLYACLAHASRPVILLDAHATFHIGDDKQWMSSDYSDYAEHNRAEVDRVFCTLIEDADLRDRLITRLMSAPNHWTFPKRLRDMVGQPSFSKEEQSRQGASYRGSRLINRLLYKFDQIRGKK